MNSIDISEAPRFYLPAPATVFGRMCAAAATVGVEAVLATFPPHPRPWQVVNPIATAAVVFTAALFCLVWPKLKGIQVHAPLGRGALSVHLLALVAMMGALLAYRSTSPISAALWMSSLGVMGVSGCLVWLPAAEWWDAVRRAGVAVVYALGAVILIMLLIPVLEQAWINGSQGFFLQRITLLAATWVLALVLPGAKFDLATDIISLPNFQATVGTPCSGVEGLALTFLFTAGWLLYMRRELRMPAALLLFPLGMATVYGYNILRIVVLLLIGNAGHAAVAVGGFHSQAGWIGFNAVALLILVMSSRVRWLMRAPAGAGVAMSDVAARNAAAVAVVPGVVVRNAAAVYLMPFLALLAATSLSKAVSAGFEPLYALRLVLVVPLIWYYRSEYRGLQWRVSPLAVAGGAAVFAAWVVGERWFSPPATDAIAAGLAGLSPWAREAWIVTRALTTIALVPLAEELAFRGMLMRRLASAEFEGVAYGAVPVWALVVSSLVFGAMHGPRWIVGTVAGLVFGWLARRSGRLPDAIVAHMVANAVLTLWVLERGQWWFW